MRQQKRTGMTTRYGQGEEELAYGLQRHEDGRQHGVSPVFVQVF
ncbi:MAG: hypothetical protein U0M53_08670 [Oscillospiraceae bacterium]|nr:hypothetical protein [Oscillospiraceae bacterium]